MPGPTHRGDQPPDVPASVPGEYADAYRSAYEKALRELEPPASESASAEDPDGAAAAGAAPAPAVGGGRHADRPSAPTPASVSLGAAGFTATEYRTRPRWLVPLAMVATALVFIGCAYVLGRMVSGDADPGTAPRPETGSVAPTPAATPTETAEPKPDAEAEPWSGAVAGVEPRTVEAGCTAPDGVDAAGRKVSYAAGRMIDGKADTAWRCEGKALGQRLRIALPSGTRLAEVGLIPGYAKTDPKTGADRYAENNRITKVRWTLADGTEMVQSMSANPADRSIRTMRVPATEGDTVTLQILEVARGSRNTTMISELRFAGAE